MYVFSGHECEWVNCDIFVTYSFQDGTGFWQISQKNQTFSQRKKLSKMAQILNFTKFPSYFSILTTNWITVCSHMSDHPYS